MTATLLHIPVILGLSIEVYIICFLIAGTTFLFCKWLFKKFIKADKIRKLTALAVALIATPVIYLGLIRLLMLWITYTPSSGFDKAQWLTVKERRFEMADNIIKTKMLISRDTTEVKQILGDPTWRQSTTTAWIYDMGIGGGGLGFMFHHLVIKFDKGKVVVVEHAKTND